NMLKSIYVSTNGGKTWSAVSSVPSNYVGSQGNYNNAILAVNASSVYVGGMESNNSTHVGEVLFTSGGFGSAATDISVDSAANGPGRSVHALVKARLGRILVATDAGIWRYAPTAGTWADINGDLSVAQITSIGLHPTDPNIVFAGTRFNGTALFDGSDQAWDLVDFNNGGQVAVNPRNASVVYHLHGGPTQSRGTTLPVATSSRAAGTWTTVGAAGTPSGFVIDPLDSTRVLVANGGLTEIVNGSSAFLNPPLAANRVAIASYQGAFVADPSFTDVADKG